MYEYTLQLKITFLLYNDLFMRTLWLLAELDMFLGGLLLHVPTGMSACLTY